MSAPGPTAGAPSWLRSLLALLAPFLGLLLVVVLFSAWGAIWKPETTFLSAFRMTLIAKQTAIVGMGAVGMTVVIVGGGIDLSVGSLLALASVLLAVTLRDGWPPAAACGVTLLAGIAAGAVNGLLVTGLRLVPFIATLGTMLLFRGVAEEIAGQKKVLAEAPAWLSTLLDHPPEGSWRMVCTGVWLVVACAIVMAVVLRATVFGRHVAAIGSNEATARLCGVPVERVKLGIYATAGLFMALAGVFEFNNLNRQGNPTSGVGLELEVIAAVVIGGGSLSGGRGSVLGSLLGALMMTTLRSGCVYAEVPDPVQKIVIGAIIVGAVAVDRVRQVRGGDR